MQTGHVAGVYDMQPGVSEKRKFGGGVAMVNMVDEAVALGKEGFAVIPLHRFIPYDEVQLDDGRIISHPASCTCEGGAKCASPGKHPMCKIDMARTEEKSIRELFKNVGACNLGVIMGKSYHCVLDVDERNGGFESLPRLMADCGITSFSKDRTAMSGSAGLHVTFACWAEKIRSGALRGYPGIDLKGSVGRDTVLVVPPSNHKSGGQYRWINRCRARDAPDELMALMVRNRVEKNADNTPKKPIKRALIIDPCRLIPDWTYETLTNGRRGAHPVHGSTTGSNFIIFPADGTWYCFRHGSRGGLLELAELLNEERTCEDFVQGSYLPLTKAERLSAIQECRNRGVSREEMVQFSTRIYT